MSFTFTEETRREAEALLSRYPNRMAALLPVLWLAQRQHGHLPLEAQEYVAEFLGLTPAHVYGVVTFYTMFKIKPVGRYHLQVCRTLSCALAGGETLVRRIGEKLKIGPGERSADGIFSLEEVECLGSCGTAPAMMVNEAYVENLTDAKLDELIERLKQAG